MAINCDYIEVDFSKFDKAIFQIEEYISLLEKKTANAQEQVDILLQSCQGPDLALFKSKWDEANGAGSTYMELVRALKSYLAFLKFAKSQYKAVQSKAISRSGGL